MSGSGDVIEDLYGYTKTEELEEEYN